MISPPVYVACSSHSTPRCRQCSGSSRPASAGLPLLVSMSRTFRRERWKKVAYWWNVYSQALNCPVANRCEALDRLHTWRSMVTWLVIVNLHETLVTYDLQLAADLHVRAWNVGAGLPHKFGYEGETFGKTRQYLPFVFPCSREHQLQHKR